VLVRELVPQRRVGHAEFDDVDAGQGRHHVQRRRERDRALEGVVADPLLAGERCPADLVHRADAAAGRVGLHPVEAPLVEQPLELAEQRVGLARRDRRGAGRAQAAVADQVVGQEHLLEPIRAELRELPRPRDRRAGVEALAGVDEQVGRVAEAPPGLAHERHVARLRLAHRPPAELHGREAPIDPAPGDVVGLCRRVAEEHARIGAHAGLEGAAEQLIDGLVRGLAGDVPERHVDARHGVGAQARAAVEVRRLAHRGGADVDCERVVPHDRAAQAAADLVREGRVDDRLDRGRAGIDLAPARDAGVGVDPHEAGVLGAVAGGAHLRQPEDDRFDVRDLHEAGGSGVGVAGDS
jgi:hypothetical protein